MTYTHGLTVDQPLSVVRLGYADWPYQKSWDDWAPFAFVPLWNSRGQPDNGYFPVDGDEHCDAVDTLRCVRVYLPGIWTVYGGFAPPVIPSAWHGTLLEDKADKAGTKYRRNRHYDPVTGRFTQEDPIGLAGGLNLYGFANGDPVNFSDPFGLCPIPQLCLAALGAGAGVVLNGAMNMAMDRPFLENWQTAAIGGAIAGATAGLAAGPEAAAAFFARGAAVSATTVGTAVGTGRVMLEAGKQGKHIVGHNNFITGRSIFSHSDPQGLLDKFAGAGARISGAAGGPGKELVDFGQVIGQVMVNGTLTNTTMGIIHYSKTGAHIVPRIP